MAGGARGPGTAAPAESGPQDGTASGKEVGGLTLDKTPPDTLIQTLAAEKVTFDKELRPVRASRSRGTVSGRRWERSGMSRANTGCIEEMHSGSRRNEEREDFQLEVLEMAMLRNTYLTDTRGIEEKR